MSEMTLSGWPSNGLEGLSNTLESLRNQLEIARLQKTAESQAREIARLTEEMESTTRRMVIGCEWFISVMKWLWKATWMSIGKVPGTNWNSGGNHLRSVFDYTITEIESTRTWVQSCEQVLGRPLELERVHQALAEARRLRAELETNWLWLTKEAEHEAKAAIARGEGVDVEVAFAHMAGLTLEELRVKVEAHKKQCHPNGDAAR